MTNHEIDEFLKSLARTGNVSLSARNAKIKRSQLYALKASNPDFAEAWSNALEEATDLLQGEAIRRAIEGFEEVKYFKGEPVGTVPGGINNEYTRFWARTPLINAHFRFNALGEPWGENITHGKIQVTLKTSGGRQLAQSPLFRLNQIRGLGNTYFNDTIWKNPKRNRIKSILLPYASGFHHSSIIRVNRQVVAHSSQNKSYTKSLEVTIGAGTSFRHNTASDNNETGLILEITFDFTEDFPMTGSQPTKVLNGFYFSTDIQATTHS